MLDLGLDREYTPSHLGLATYILENCNENIGAR